MNLCLTKIYIMKLKFYSSIFLIVLTASGLSAQNEIVIAPGDDLIATVAGASDGDMIVLEAGTYVARYENIIIDKSLTIKAETNVKPLVYINQFDVLGEDVDIYIEGIEFSSASVDSMTLEEDLEDLEGDYFLNLHSDLVSCGDITVVNCIIRNLERSLVRGDRSNYTVDNFLFDKLIVTDLRGGGDYGPFRTKSKITYNTFTLTNSTFYNITNKLLDNQDTPSYPMDFLVKNCTFYKWGGGKSGQYLFDIQDNDQANLKIQDCIFGKTNDDPDADPPVTVNGWRYAEGAYMEMITTAMTPDFVLTDGTFDDVTWDKAEFNYPDTDPDWADPEAGDFTLPEGSDLLESSQTGGIIGDPRWDPDFGVGTGQLRGPEKISLYPNPANRVFYLELPEAWQGSRVSIYNTLGSRVLSYEHVESDRPVRVAGLVPGLYFVRVGDRSENTLKLMVK